MQAISLPNFENKSRTAFALLYGKVSVSNATASETPDELGTPNVKVPEPALTSNASECP